MKLRLHLPIAVLFAVITVAPGEALPQHAVSMNSWLALDDSDEPSRVAATGDFNHDGIADVAEATSARDQDSDQYSLTILLGRADGKFKPVLSHNLIGRDPRALVVDDFNGDGSLDVIVGDGDGTLLEFMGDGKGNMSRSGKIAAVGSVVSIATGHFTHDNHLDLVVSDVRSNSAVILLGLGDGSFRPAWSFQLPKQGTPFHIATADFNRDGVIDLVIMNEDDDNYEVMLGNGNGTFTYSPELSHLRDPNSYCPS